MVPGTSLIGSGEAASNRRLPPLEPSNRPLHGTYPCPSCRGHLWKPPLGAASIVRGAQASGEDVPAGAASVVPPRVKRARGAPAGRLNAGRARSGEARPPRVGDRWVGEDVDERRPARLEGADQ